MNLVDLLDFIREAEQITKGCVAVFKHHDANMLCMETVFKKDGKQLIIIKVYTREQLLDSAILGIYLQQLKNIMDE